MRTPPHWPVMVTLSVCVSAAWMAMSVQPAVDAARLAPATVAAPDTSPYYPPPRVDANAPPQEPAPTF